MNDKNIFDLRVGDVFQVLSSNTSAWTFPYESPVGLSSESSYYVVLKKDRKVIRFTKFKIGGEYHLEDYFIYYVYSHNYISVSLIQPQCCPVMLLLTKRKREDYRFRDLLDRKID